MSGGTRATELGVRRSIRPAFDMFNWWDVNNGDFIMGIVEQSTRKGAIVKSGVQAHD